MSFKKISLLLVSSIILFAGCSFPGTSKKEDFSSLYQAHTKSQIASLRSIGEKLGYVGKYETKGILRAMVDIPTIFSGAASTSYDAVIEGYGLSQDSRVTFKDPTFKYETLLASGSLFAKEASFISRGGDMYIKYDSIDGAEMIDDLMKEVLTKYNNVWLGLTESNILETLSGSSEEDIAAYQMGQAFGKLKIDDVEEYLTKYPLWKEKKSLGETNGLVSFEVELAVENVLAFVDEFSKKSTGKGLKDEARKSLEASLIEKNIRGTVSYDPKNPKLSKANLTIDALNSAPMTLVLDEGTNGWQLSSSSSGSTINIALKEKGEGYAISANIVEDSQDVGSLIANINYNNKKFSHFDIKVSSPTNGVTLSLEHNLASDGTFTGGLDAGMGTLTWNGKVGANLSLESFQLKGAMIGASLSLDLSPGSAGMLEGPLLLKSGDEVVVSAKVGLILNKEVIHLNLDVANPEMPEISSHAELHIEGKKEKWNGKIEVPEKSTPFSEFSEALRAIAPSDTWTDDLSSEDLSSEDLESDYEMNYESDANTLEDTISGTILQ